MARIASVNSESTVLNINFFLHPLAGQSFCPRCSSKQIEQIVWWRPQDRMGALAKNLQASQLSNFEKTRAAEAGFSFSACIIFSFWSLVSLLTRVLFGAGTLASSTLLLDAILQLQTSTLHTIFEQFRLRVSFTFLSASSLIDSSMATVNWRRSASTLSNVPPSSSLRTTTSGIESTSCSCGGYFIFLAVLESRRNFLSPIWILSSCCPPNHRLIGIQWRRRFHLHMFLRRAAQILSGRGRWRKMRSNLWCDDHFGEVVFMRRPGLAVPWLWFPRQLECGLPRGIILQTNHCNGDRGHGDCVHRLSEGHNSIVVVLLPLRGRYIDYLFWVWIRHLSSDFGKSS